MSLKWSNKNVLLRDQSTTHRHLLLKMSMILTWLKTWWMNLLTTLQYLRKCRRNLSLKLSDRKTTTSLEPLKCLNLIQPTRETGSALLTPSSATTRSSVEPNKVNMVDLSWRNIACINTSMLNPKQLLKKMIVLAWEVITSNACLKWKRNFWNKRPIKVSWWTDRSPKRFKFTMQRIEILN